MSTLEQKMAAPNNSTLQVILDFIKDSWPMLTIMVTVYAAIKEIGKYVAKRQEEKFKLIIDSYIGHDIKSLSESIDELRQEIRDMKKAKP